MTELFKSKLIQQNIYFLQSDNHKKFYESVFIDFMFYLLTNEVINKAISLSNEQLPRTHSHVRCYYIGKHVFEIDDAHIILIS